MKLRMESLHTLLPVCKHRCLSRFEPAHIWNQRRCIDSLGRNMVNQDGSAWITSLRKKNGMLAIPCFIQHCIHCFQKCWWSFSSGCKQSLVPSNVFCILSCHLMSKFSDSSSICVTMTVNPSSADGNSLAQGSDSPRPPPSPINTGLLSPRNLFYSPTTTTTTTTWTSTSTSTSSSNSIYHSQLFILPCQQTQTLNSLSHYQSFALSIFRLGFSLTHLVSLSTIF